MQALRTILLHLDETARTAERIRFARTLAETMDAHVACRPCSMSEIMLYPFTIGAGAQAVEVLLRAQEASRDRLYLLFSTESLGSPRMHWVESDNAAPWDFSRHAFYADLMVLGQPDRSDPMDHLLPEDFLATVIMQSGRPALVLPYAGSIGSIGQRVLIAWNESRESARAVTAALPWLCTASDVHAVVYGEHVQPPLERLRMFLRGHGLEDVRLHAGGRAADVGNQLLSLAADTGADLLVMGCYGHSRAREWILGGATRTVLASMTVPVLLAH